MYACLRAACLLAARAEPMNQFGTLIQKDSSERQRQPHCPRHYVRTTLGMARAGMGAVHDPLALIADPDWAMRELMRRTLEQVGYAVVQSSNSLELDAALRARAGRSTPCVLLVVSGTLALASREVIDALADHRVEAGLPPPYVLLTCEFGTLNTCIRPELPRCVAVGLLEKPFDFGLLQGIAYRCRTAGSMGLPQSRSG